MIKALSTGYTGRLIAVRCAHGALKYPAYRPIVATVPFLVYFREKELTSDFWLGFTWAQTDGDHIQRFPDFREPYYFLSIAERDGEVIHDHIDFQKLTKHCCLNLIVIGGLTS